MPMTKEQVAQEFHKLMEQYQLTGWTFDFATTARRVGCCWYSKKLLQFSEHYLHIPDTEIIDTSRHEVAHALVGRGNRHNHIWKAKAIELGAKPRACVTGLRSTKPPLYILWCKNCNDRIPLYRKRKHGKLTSCGKCCPGRFNLAYLHEVVSPIEIGVENEVVRCS